METYQKIVLIFGFILVAGTFLFIDPFIAGIVFVVLLGLILSFAMMNTSKRFRAKPELIGVLSEDAKAVIIKNKGEAQGLNIHVAIVPLDVEFDVPPLDPDTQYEFAVPHMIETAKAVISYEDAKGREYHHSSPLSAMGGGEEDLLKPMIPMFGWK